LRESETSTQVMLAERLGVSFPTVNRWENKKTIPSQLAWKKLRDMASDHDDDGSTGEVVVPSGPPILDFTGNADVIRVIVEGERLTFGHLANPAFATEVSSIDPLPHQRIAVYDHMLKQSRLRFLLADDAGAGKTIMTGLYIREMLSRRLLRRVLIIPPAGLIGN
ncbi:MAG: helix-turn-helix domain-containing protein, partial [Planctomycetaceae bacterium]